MSDGNQPAIEESTARRRSTFASSGKGYHIRWSRIRKTVQLQEPTSASALGMVASNNRKEDVESGLSDGSSGSSTDVAPTPTTKVILSDISGSAEPGEVMALMGPSGSGKTSLLNALSGRTSYDSGVLSINGRALKGDHKSSEMKRLKSKIAYVKQSDIFFTHLSVRDQLGYTAMLRMPQDMAHADKIAEVDRILEMLRLTKVADSKICMLSGGEKKRVNIGTELLTNPKCILLDEPTSGLDSTSAVLLIKTLQALAVEESKTIVTSIHQPNSALFRSFDKLLLLAEGHVVYFGTPRHSITYLNELHVPCPDGYNAADHWMDILVGDKSLKECVEERLLEQMAERNEESKLDDSEHGSSDADSNHIGSGDQDGKSDPDETEALIGKTESIFGNREEGSVYEDSISSNIGIDFDVDKFIAKAAKVAGIEIDSAADKGKEANESKGKDTSETKPTEISTDTMEDSDETKPEENTDEAIRALDQIPEMAKPAVSDSAFDPAVKPKNDMTVRQHLIDSWDGEAIAVAQDEALLSNGETEISTSVHATDDVSGKDPNFQKYATSWLMQYRVLTHRAFQNSKADIFTPLNLIKSAALGFVSGVLFFQIPYTELTVRDRSSFFFFISAYWVFDSLFQALMSFPSEQVVILKERSSASYHLSAYFMAKTTSDAPTRFALPIIYMIVSFWMAGISDRFEIFLYCVGVALLSVLAGESVGLLIGATFSDLRTAMAVAAVGTLGLMLLGGFLIDNVPAFVSWAGYLSVFKYAFDAHRQLIFQPDLPCDGSNALPGLCEGSDTTVVSSEELLDYLGVDHGLGFNVGMLVLLTFLPRYLAYLVLRGKKEAER